MPLTDTQVRKLRAKLDARHVKARRANGIELCYVEGWHVIAEANRIFGYDAWDRRTLANTCVWQGERGQHFGAAYTAKVRVCVRAGDTTIVREGSGTGNGKAPTPGEAHELALKGAETDATKRALATFGNPFGLALYDPEQVGVRKVRTNNAPAAGPWKLRAASGSDVASFDKPSAFATALREAMQGAQDIETLFAIWEQNVDTVRSINRCLKQDHLPRSGFAPQILSDFKRCAVALATPQPETKTKVQHVAPVLGDVEGVRRPKIDKSVLTIGEVKRVRCKEHLRFVASHPCLVCGRSPSQAHHVRCAQSRGLGLKVSDEFTVPLCAIHHRQVHSTGRESDWWQKRKIDPLEVAQDLWRESTARPLAANVALLTGSEDSSTDGDGAPHINVPSDPIRT